MPRGIQIYNWLLVIPWDVAFIRDDLRGVIGKERLPIIFGCVHAVRHALKPVLRAVNPEQGSGSVPSYFLVLVI